MLTDQDVAGLIDALDLTSIPACPLCLFDFAWTMHEGKLDRRLLGRTCRWMWPDIEDDVRAAVVRARMRELPHSEEGLRDVVENGHRGVVARGVVTALARRLADEFDQRSGGYTGRYDSRRTKGTGSDPKGDPRSARPESR